MALDMENPETQSTESDATGRSIVAYHVHLTEPPFCRSWSRSNAKERADNYAFDNGIQTVFGPVDYTSNDCPYRMQREEALTDLQESLGPENEAAGPLAPPEEPEQLDELPDPEPEYEGVAATPAVFGYEEPSGTGLPMPEQEVSVMVGAPPLANGGMPPELVITPEMAAAAHSHLVGTMTTTSGTPLPVDLSTITCDECGEPMADHVHPNAAGQGGAVTTTTRKTTVRKKQEDRPTCPFCQGPIHFNDAGAKTNFECLYRQRLVAVGDITDPKTQRLPVATAGDIATLGDWLKEQALNGVDLKYGKMESAAGGAATYAGLRPKPEPKPKPAGPSIEQVAEQAAPLSWENTITDAEAVAEVEVPKETKEDRKKKRQELLKKSKK